MLAFRSVLLAACLFAPAAAKYSYHIKFAVELGGYTSSAFGGPDVSYGTLATDNAAHETPVKYDFKASVADALGIPGIFSIH
jgi:hypothetical protein